MIFIWTLIRCLWYQSSCFWLVWLAMLSLSFSDFFNSFWEWLDEFLEETDINLIPFSRHKRSKQNKRIRVQIGFLGEMIVFLSAGVYMHKLLEYYQIRLTTLSEVNGLKRKRSKGNFISYNNRMAISRSFWERSSRVGLKTTQFSVGYLITWGHGLRILWL